MWYRPVNVLILSNPTTKCGKIKTLHLIHAKIEIAMQMFIGMYAVHINLMNHLCMSPNYTIYALSGCTIILIYTVCNWLIWETIDRAVTTVCNVWVVLPWLSLWSVYYMFISGDMQTCIPPFRYYVISELHIDITRACLLFFVSILSIHGGTHIEMQCRF